MPIIHVWLENVKTIRDSGHYSPVQINAQGIVQIYERLRELESEVVQLKKRLGISVWEEDE